MRRDSNAVSARHARYKRKINAKRTGCKNFFTDDKPMVVHMAQKAVIFMADHVPFANCHINTNGVSGTYSNRIELYDSTLQLGRTAPDAMRARALSTSSTLSSHRLCCRVSSAICSTNSALTCQARSILQYVLDAKRNKSTVFTVQGDSQQLAKGDSRLCRFDA